MLENLALLAKQPEPTIFGRMPNFGGAAGGPPVANTHKETPLGMPSLIEAK
jgi:hypothetical protein